MPLSIGFRWASLSQTRALRNPGTWAFGGRRASSGPAPRGARAAGLAMFLARGFTLRGLRGVRWESVLRELVAISARSRVDIALIPPSSAPAGADDGRINPISARDLAEIATSSHRTVSHRSHLILRTLGFSMHGFMVRCFVPQTVPRAPPFGRAVLAAGPPRPQQIAGSRSATNHVRKTLVCIAVLWGVIFIKR